MEFVTEKHGPGTFVVRVLRDRAQLSMFEFFEALRQGEVHEFNDHLTDCPFHEYMIRFDETSCSESKRTPCTFTIKRTKFSSKRTDPSAFQEHFSISREDIVATSFPSISGKSYLVVPLPGGKNRKCFKHVGSFARHAPDEWIEGLWTLVGETFFDLFCNSDHRNTRFVLETHGHDVDWLHVKFRYVE